MGLQRTVAGRTLTSQPKLLGLIDYQIFLEMGLRACGAPLLTIRENKSEEFCMTRNNDTTVCSQAVIFYFSAVENTNAPSKSF